MEWMLQVADEFDDAFGVLMHGWLGLVAEVGVLLLAGFGIIAEFAGPWFGAQPALLGAGALTANVAALLKAREARLAERA
jgi:hypothetical protein